MSEIDELKLKLIDTQLQLLQAQAFVLQYQREHLLSQAQPQQTPADEAKQS